MANIEQEKVFLLPDLGEGVAEGEIVQWLVAPGDAVEEDQGLVEVMTDKVTAEIPSPFSGTIKSLGGKPGEVLRVGAPLVVFAVGDEDALKAGDTTEAAKAPDAVDGLPQAVAEAPAVLAASTIPPAPAMAGGQVKAAPAVRQLAQRLGVNLTQVAPTGPRGRVTLEDVQKAAGSVMTTPHPVTSAPARVQASSRSSLPSGGEAVKTTPYKGMRRQIGDHLQRSKQTVPHFSCAELVDMTPLKRVRDRLKAAAEAEGVKLSYLPFVLRAVVLGLQKYPVLNSRFDGEMIQTFSACHLGLAVSVGDGLVVPVIHHAEQQTVKELALTVQQLADKARAGRLQAADLQGGTFTISNVGAVGACMFGLPIVNAPEVAILAVNQVRKMPMVMTDTGTGQDQLGVGYGMYLSLSADHRVLDGAIAVQFLQAVKEYLEAPETLFWV